MNFFEFDATKSLSNRSKHGVDFVEAQELWNDTMLLEIPAKTEDEPRYLVIGLIEGKHVGYCFGLFCLFFVGSCGLSLF
jgi:hypothetical protein